MSEINAIQMIFFTPTTFPTALLPLLSLFLSTFKTELHYFKKNILLIEWLIKLRVQGVMERVCVCVSYKDTNHTVIQNERNIN